MGIGRLSSKTIESEEQRVDDLKTDETLDMKIARLSSKRSEFNPSVVNSENSEEYGCHSKQQGTGKVKRKWISKEGDNTSIEKVKTLTSYWSPSKTKES